MTNPVEEEKESAIQEVESPIVGENQHQERVEQLV